jgi:hypothetical protein
VTFDPCVLILAGLKNLPRFKLGSIESSLLHRGLSLKKKWQNYSKKEGGILSSLILFK